MLREFLLSRADVMQRKGKDGHEMTDTSEKYLKALVYLQVQAQTGGTSFGKPELLLSKAGFGVREVADILGKTPNAVSKILSRAKAAQGGSDE